MRQELKKGVQHERSFFGRSDVLTWDNQDRSTVDSVSLAAAASLSLRSLRIAVNECSVEDNCCSVGTRVELERKGINPQELLMAPKPDNSPRIIVPRIISRDNALVITSWEARPSGRGICIIAKSNNMTGIKLIATRMPRSFVRPEF